MPSGDYTKKESHSVYKKALVICHEDEKQLSLIQLELEKDKLQAYIDYKLEARRLQKELLTLRREQAQLMNEARQNLKEKKSVDDIAKEKTNVQGARNRNLEALKLQRKFSLPHLTPTQRNIPKIMKRTLSFESEFYTWTLGLPEVDSQPPKMTGNIKKLQPKSAKNSKERLESNKETKEIKKATHLVTTERNTSTEKKKATSTQSNEVRLPAVFSAQNRKIPSTGCICKDSRNTPNSKLPPLPAFKNNIA